MQMNRDTIRGVIVIALLIAALIGCGPQSTSPPGSVWTMATEHAAFPAHGRHTSVIFNEKMWVIGGWPNVESFAPSPHRDVWFSADGISWSAATLEAAFGRRLDHTSVVSDGRMWVIGGSSNSASLNDIWASDDGADWQLINAAAPFGARKGHASVVFNGKIWVVGGEDDTAYKNDVWYSADGINWSRATAAAAFSARKGHAGIVFDGKMWVIGGEDGTAGKNDVWYSADGANWVQATGGAAFTARSRFSCVVYDNKIWIMGGRDISDSSNGQKDVWYSMTGFEWFRATADASFGHRTHHSSVVHNNKIWVIGGANDLGGTASLYDNDVWWSN